MTTDSDTLRPTPTTTTTATTGTTRLRSVLRASRQAAHRTHAWFLLGVGLVALHVADDNFLQPQPGTSASDHVASGLVPLGLLALAAWGFPRMRAGLRGLVALVAGVFGIVFAVEAVYYSRAVGPSGDDYTGLLSAPAGLLLVGVGAVVLWRSRRLDDRRRWRYPRRGLITVVAALGTYLLVFPVAFGYGVTHIQRAAVPPNALGVAHEDVTLTTSDGLELEGWYIPSRNGAAIVSYPGRKGPQAHARMLAQHGYGVLLFDRRGEGESDGDGNLFGWGGEKDIFAAVEFLKDRPEVDPDRIGGMGFSVGGEMMLQAAAQNDDIAAVLSEGAGTRQVAEQRDELPAATFWGLSPALFLQTYSTALWSNTMTPPKLVDLVPEIAPRPVFLIWAPNGGNMETLNPTFHRLAGPNASIWEMPTAMHIKGIEDQPAEYERRVVGFFDEALAP